MRMRPRRVLTLLLVAAAAGVAALLLLSARARPPEPLAADAAPRAAADAAEGASGTAATWTTTTTTTTTTRRSVGAGRREAVTAGRASDADTAHASGPGTPTTTTTTAARAPTREQGSAGAGTGEGTGQAGRIGGDPLRPQASHDTALQTDPATGATAAVVRASHSKPPTPATSEPPTTTTASVLPVTASKVPVTASKPTTTASHSKPPMTATASKPPTAAAATKVPPAKELAVTTIALPPLTASPPLFLDTDADANANANADASPAPFLRVVRPPRMRVVVPLLSDDDRLYAAAQAVPGEMDVFVDAFLEPPNPEPPFIAPAVAPCVVLIVRKNPHAAPDPTKIDPNAIAVRAHVPGLASTEVVELPRLAVKQIKNCRLRCSINGKDNPNRDNLSSITYVQRYCSPRLPSSVDAVTIEVTYLHTNPNATARLEYRQTWQVQVPVPSAAAAAIRQAPVAMMTKFLHTPDMLHPWIEHYAALGVGFFYLYYNAAVDGGADGGLADALNSPAMRAVLARPDVLLVEWTPPFLDAWAIRFSQAPAMQSSWNRYRAYHDYLLHFDMDEYLLLPAGDTVPRFLARQNATCAVFQFPSAFGWLDCTAAGSAWAAEPIPRWAALRRCSVARAADWFTTKRQKMALRTHTHVAVINTHQAQSELATELACAVPPQTAHFVHLLNLSRNGNAVPHGSVNETELEAAHRAAVVPVVAWPSL